jgi:hypothetical protein
VWTAALAARRTPADVALDTVRWWQHMTDRRRPGWASHPRVVRRTPLTALRDFTPKGAAHVIPTLVLPPQAGHDSSIVDFSPQQSQMRTIRAEGLDHLFALEWIGATQETKDATIDDVLADVDAAVRQVGARSGQPRRRLPGRVGGDDLRGARARARQHADDRRRADRLPRRRRHHLRQHAGAGRPRPDLLPRARRARRRRPEGRLPARRLHRHPPRERDRPPAAAPANVSEAHHVERYRAFEDWFKHTQDLPGPFYLWLVEHLFRDNRLIEGTLEIGGRHVDLGRITCPVNLLAGAEDHITPPEQVFALADAVSTPRKHITQRTTTGGHLGLFMGTEALRDHWPVVMGSVLEHSKHRPKLKASTARRRARAATPMERPLPAA